MSALDSKVRQIIEGSLPGGPLPEGEVILSPEQRPRKMVVWRAACATVFSASVREVPAAAAIWKSERSIWVKREQIMAEFWLSVAWVFYSPEHLIPAWLPAGNLWMLVGVGTSAIPQSKVGVSPGLPGARRPREAGAGQPLPRRPLR